MSTLGERIAEIRKQQGLTQAGLARMAGISTSSIAMYETNRRQPDTNTLQLLTDALGVKFEEDQFEPIAITAKRASPVVKESKPAPGKSAPVAKQKAFDAETSVKPAEQVDNSADAGWTNLTLSRDEARFILFMRMHADSRAFLQSYMNADEQKRKQVEKAMRLIEAFQN